MPHLPHFRQTGQRGAIRAAICWKAALVLTLLLNCAGTMLAGAQTEEEDRKITAIRFWSLGDVTRIVVESSGEFRFKADRLHSPERVFFDLMGTRLQVNGTTHGSLNLHVGDQFMRQIRVAEPQRSVTRVVFDLESPVEYTTSQLANPDRLIIEFHSPLSAKLPERNRVSRSERATQSASPIVPERKTVRIAHLDFSAYRLRREMELRAMTINFPETPSPFDYTLRYATRQFNKPDPYPSVFGRKMPALPPPPVRKRQASTIPSSTLAKATAPPRPILAPDQPVNPPPVSAKVTRPLTDPLQPQELGLPAKPNSQAETMIRVLGLKMGRVVIDPGHGGHDAGTSGSDDFHEKDIVLDVAKRLGVLIEERLNSEVIYTRTDDTFVPLTRRSQIANEKKADLFLSIHVNSSPARSAAGVETYYLNFTSSKSALDVATRENAGADKNIGELQDLLKQIALTDKVEESREFASRVQNSLLMLSPKSSRPTRDRGIKRAPFVVLIGASMPSILAEIGFISNAQDETQMRRPEYRQRIAEALYKGVAAYANSLSHFQVAQQQGSTGTKSAQATAR